MKRVRHARWMLAVLAISALSGFFFVSSARAQTPSGTEQTPGSGDAVLSLELAGASEPIAVGSEFQVQVSVEHVQHLGAFELTIDYDPAKVTFVSVADLGKFVGTAPRGGTQLFCPDPEKSNGAVLLACTTLGPPVCLGGLAGVTGDGLLATATFKSNGGGAADIELRDTTLLLDDINPCDPNTGSTLDIPHTAEGTSVRLANVGGSDHGGGNSTLLIVIAVVVAVVVVGGVAGLVWRRRRGAAS